MVHKTIQFLNSSFTGKLVFLNGPCFIPFASRVPNKFTDLDKLSALASKHLKEHKKFGSRSFTDIGFSGDFDILMLYLLILFQKVFQWHVKKLFVIFIKILSRKAGEDVWFK